MFLRQSQGKHYDSRENETNWFPEGPYIKCFVMYLDFPLNNHLEITEKQRWQSVFIHNGQSC